MDELITGISTLWVLVGTIIVNQLISMLRTVISKKKMSKEVTEIKKELTQNGGEKTIKDDLSKVIKNQDELNRKVDKISSRMDTVANESERIKLELELNQSSDPQYLANEFGEATFVNYAMIKMFGMNSAHLMKHKRLNCISEKEQRLIIDEEIKYAVTNKRDLDVTYEIRQRKGTHRSDETLLTVNDSWVTRNDDNGKFKWLLGKIKPATL